MFAGDPASTDPNYIPGELPTDGTGTYYGPPSLCSNGSTGLLTSDSLLVVDPSGGPISCVAGNYAGVGGCPGSSNVYASFYLRLQADTSICGTSPGPFEYCQSNPNSTGVNGTLDITGSASISANNVVLTATLPPNSTGFFLTSQTQGFTMNPAGSTGNICLAGDIGRFVGNDQVKNSGIGSEISLSTQLGEWSLLSVPDGSAPYAAVAGMESNFQLWHRDNGFAGPTSNFTNASSVTWID